jgi:hypothetical protein
MADIQILRLRLLLMCFSKRRCSLVCFSKLYWNQHYFLPLSQAVFTLLRTYKLGAMKSGEAWIKLVPWLTLFNRKIYIFLIHFILWLTQFFFPSKMDWAADYPKRRRWTNNSWSNHTKQICCEHACEVANSSQYQFHILPTWSLCYQ